MDIKENKIGLKHYKRKRRSFQEILWWGIDSCCSKKRQLILVVISLQTTRHGEAAIPIPE
jgi:hypothetical protein